MALPNLVMHDRNAVIRHSKDWIDYAGTDWSNSIMTVDVSDRFHAKQGRSVGRWTLQNPQGRKLVVYLKRHFELPWWRGLLARLVPGAAWSPGMQEWEHLQWAEKEGIPVPRAVAAGEFRGPRCKLQSFLAVEELTNQIGLHEAVPLASQRFSPDDFAKWKRSLIIEMARLSRELHRRRVFHKDLYFCHFYIAEQWTTQIPERWQGLVSMIDFHRLSRHRLGWQWFISKDLAQLLYSSDEPGVTARDRLRFWKHYHSGDWSPVQKPGGWLKRAVLWKWRRYVRHNLKRFMGMPKAGAS